MQQLPMIRSGGDREAGSSQGAVISRHQNRQSFTEHRHDLEVTQLAAKPRGGCHRLLQQFVVDLDVRAHD
jgi:hypothetical protein